jgi:hypothetical protein
MGNNVLVFPSSMIQPTPRVVAIAHRVKAIVRDDVVIEARPTKVLITESDGTTQSLALETERDEIDLVYGIFPTKWRDAEQGEDLSSFKPHHIKPRKDKPTKVPCVYEGLKAGDTILSILGGSGDGLAFAISRHGIAGGWKLFRLPPHILKDMRGDAPYDAKDRFETELATLVTLWQYSPKLFYESDVADRERILVTESFRTFKDAQRERIKCQQRLRQRSIGKQFRTENGGFPEGNITDWFDAEKASDPILSLLEKEEGMEKRKLEKALKGARVWQVIGGVEGIGPSVAGPIVAAIGDIRRFATEAKFMAFCGVHCLKQDGTKFAPDEARKEGDAIMARRRAGGQKNNWNPMVRQALYLFSDQFSIYRPDSVWGQRFLENKKFYREKHPEVIEVADGKKRYYDGHIHNLAKWKTLREFVKWLYAEWKDVEAKRNTPPVVEDAAEQSAVSSSLQ